MKRSFLFVVALVGLLSLANNALAAPIPPSTGQLLWLAADTNIATSGGSVTGWNDAATNSPRVSAIVGNPTLGSQVYPNGSHATVVFNGSSGIALNNSAALAQQNLSIYVVATISAAQTARIFVADYHNNGASNGWGSGISDGSTSQVKWFTGPDGSDPISSTTGLAMTQGTPYVVTTTIDAGGKFASLFDGTATTSVTNPNNAIPYDGSEAASVGFLNAFGGVQFVQGNISEVLIYSGINATTRGQVAAYLNSKYYATPEPGTFALLGIGAMGLLAMARRRRTA